MPVERAPDPVSPTVQDVGVDLGGPDILVPEQLLHRADVVPVLQQMRGERVPERVGGYVLRDPRIDHGASDGLLRSERGPSQRRATHSTLPLHRHGTPP